jgi:hypothetical protein
MIPPAFVFRGEDGEVELAQALGVADDFDCGYEPELAVLVLNIALINFWNRLNITTRQVAGEWVTSAAGQSWSKEHADAQ